MQRSHQTEFKAKTMVELLEKKQTIQDMLPHLYGTDWYNWSLKFFHAKDRYMCLNAANQIGKSSTQIRKAIHWATETKLWPKLWKKKPTQFWYFYPDSDVATIEFNEKWVKEWLPRGEMQEHAKFGWRAIYEKRPTGHRIGSGWLHPDQSAR